VLAASCKWMSMLSDRPTPIGRLGHGANPDTRNAMSANRDQDVVFRSWDRNFGYLKRERERERKSDLRRKKRVSDDKVRRGKNHV
jgi:hypothetical protein